MRTSLCLDMPDTRRPARGRWAGRLALLLAVSLLLAGCVFDSGARQLSDKAQAMWESGRYQDAARNFITVADLYPGSSLAEPSLYWAGCLYQYYIQDDDQAARQYQRLLVNYPKGDYFYSAKLNLAEVYATQKDTLHRALQIYQQLVLAPRMEARRDWLRMQLARLDVQMGRMDQARMALRDLLVHEPHSKLLPQAYYLVGYSYYLEKRYDLALFAMQRIPKVFPGTPTALRAQYFVADTLEEQGHMREALAAYQALQGKYPDPGIVDKRIKTLQARIRRGVR